jgi:predicted LPLAT superfamily acyltransferase
MASFTFNSPLGEPSKEISVSATSGFNVLRLEKQILETPYNWFNFYDYWQNDEQ